MSLWRDLPLAPEEATSDLFLETFLDSFPPDETVLVVSCDELPRRRHHEDSFTYIVNTSRRREAGTHFVLIAKRADSLIYLDSLNLPYFLHQDIPNFLSLYAHCDQIRLKHQYQDNDSWYCGFFCLLFAYLLNESTQDLAYEPLSIRDRIQNNCRVLRNLGVVMHAYWRKQKEA